MKNPLTIEELAQSAQQLVDRSLPDSKNIPPIRTRTIRYWTKEGLIKTPVGHKALYAPDEAYRCAFIRLLNREKTFPLKTIKYVLSKVDAGTIERVAKGEEMIEFEGGCTREEWDRRANQGEQVVAITQYDDAEKTSTSLYPQNSLGAISDLEKEALIAQVLNANSEAQYRVRITNFSQGTHPSKPTRMRIEIFPESGELDDEATWQPLRAISDSTLCIAIADAFQDRTGENYVMIVSDKQYGRPFGRIGPVCLAFSIGLQDLE